MVSLTGFLNCCGADILQGFASGTDQSGVQNPEGTHGFKLDATGLNYERDADGNQIPITFRDKFVEEFNKKRKMAPNRMYCCILNQKQYDAHKMGWPKLLKSLGFEFVRSWSNSVHDGSYTYGMETKEGATATKDHSLYLFVLCTDDKGRGKDFTRPPKGWEKLPGEVQLTEVASLKAA